MAPWGVDGSSPSACGETGIYSLAGEAGNGGGGDGGRTTVSGELENEIITSGLTNCLTEGKAGENRASTESEPAPMGGGSSSDIRGEGKWAPPLYLGPEVPTALPHWAGQVPTPVLRDRLVPPPSQQWAVPVASSQQVGLETPQAETSETREGQALPLHLQCTAPAAPIQRAQRSTGKAPCSLASVAAGETLHGSTPVTASVATTVCTAAATRSTIAATA